MFVNLTRQDLAELRDVLELLMQDGQPSHDRLAKLARKLEKELEPKAAAYSLEDDDDGNPY